MKGFSIGKVYVNGNMEKVVEINPLPENYCSFDCVFCPFGRTQVKTDQIFDFKEMEAFLGNLEELLKDQLIDLVFINPDGELLANGRILEVINLIKKYAVKVKIISNGYLFNRDAYKEILNHCDRVIGELAVTSEEHFQKTQRPLQGYTFKEYVSNMEKFNKQYTGKFILDITILKNYSDSNENVERFKEIIRRIKPAGIIVQTPEEGELKEAFGVDEARLEEIEKQLNMTLSIEK
jgi:wyosine [tRNA(Phe)-imidazoG37] synthetase (radical SAM superfamily)